MPVEPTRLTIWTIYRGPAYPMRCTAVEFVIGPGTSTETGRKMVGPLDALRQELERIGGVPLARSPEDDETIVESWI